MNPVYIQFADQLHTLTEPDGNGWVQTITLSGFSSDELFGSDGLQPSELALSFAEPDARLTHQIVATDPDTGVSLVQLSFDQPLVSLMLNGAPMPEPDPGVFEILAGRIVSDGQIFDVLILDDFVNDRIHFIQLGGAPLPDGTDVAAVDAFWGALEDFGPIPDGEPTSAGTPIPLADIPGAVVSDTDDTPPDDDPVEPSGQPLVLDVAGQDGATITYEISIDPALVTNAVLDELLFTLNFDDALISYVAGSISGGFTATPGAEALVIAGTDLDISNLDDPILSFDMQLAPVAGAGSVSFDISDISVNGVAMEDQTGPDGFDLAYDAAFFTLGGVVDIRDLPASPISLAGTSVSFDTGTETLTATTGVDGAFTFGLLEAGTTGELSLLRDYNAQPDGADKALGIQDVLALFRMVVDAPGLSVDDTDRIAGDFNDDGVVNIQDVLGLFRHIVGVADAPEPEYLFVDADDIPATSLGDVPDIPGTFAIGPLAADIDMSFLGILTGDLQGHV